jgi:hypothetical protein
MAISGSAPAQTDVAGQIAIVQGVDSNVFQTGGSGGAPLTRHPAAFTSLEASLVVVSFGEVPGDGGDVRVFGRALQYEPLGESFESRAARAGLALNRSARLDRRTTLLSSLAFSAGSLQAARGTDAGLDAIDPISTRRSTWDVSGSETFVMETSPLTTVRTLVGGQVGGTISETLPGGDARHGVDFLLARTRVSASHRLSRLTAFETALLVERARSVYVLPLVGRSESALDSAAITATVGLTHLLSRTTTGSLGVGAAYALPQIGETGSAVPVASAGLVHVEDAWSASALASFGYAVARARIGSGPSATGTLLFIGKPLRTRTPFDVVAEASGERTGIVRGANDGTSVSTVGGSMTLRWGFAGSFGLLAGYDFRASRASGLAVGTPWYVRHLGFVGLSVAFSGGALPLVPTLARPAVTPFTP